MNITLRKASTLQSSINEIVKSIEFKTEVSINEFQDAEAEIAQVSKDLKTNIDRRENLMVALYEIRKSVSGANHAASVDSRLADVAHLEKQIQFYSGFVGKQVRESEKVVAGKLDKIRNDKSDTGRSRIYGYSDTVSTSVFTKEDIDGFRKVVAGLKKQKQKLQDELLEANVRTEITLSEQAQKTLQAEGLI